MGRLYYAPLPGESTGRVEVIAPVLESLLQLNGRPEAKEFIAAKTNGFREFKDSLTPFTLDHAETVTGLPRDQIVRLATMIHESKGTCILWAMGVTQQLPTEDKHNYSKEYLLNDIAILYGGLGLVMAGMGALALRRHLRQAPPPGDA